MGKAGRLTIATLVALVAAWLVVGATVSAASTTWHDKIVTNTSTGLFHYKPKSLTIHKGDTVKWTNKTSVLHSVTFNNGSYSKNVAPGSTIGRTFKHIGTFHYHCIFHSYMKGTVSVT